MHLGLAIGLIVAVGLGTCLVANYRGRMAGYALGYQDGKDGADYGLHRDMHSWNPLLPSVG